LLRGNKARIDPANPRGRRYFTGREIVASAERGFDHRGKCQLDQNAIADPQSAA
jgi:hypothetical protein